MEFTIKIAAPELAHAILELANILAMSVSSEAAKFEMAAASQGGTAAPVVTAAQSTPNVMPVQTQAQATFAPAAPLAPPVGVPVTPPSYTMDQLAVAATQLVDAGRREELIALLANFGVQALTALPKEQYGTFATALRGLGARL